MRVQTPGRNSYPAVIATASSLLYYFEPGRSPPQQARRSATWSHSPPRLLLARDRNQAQPSRLEHGHGTLRAPIPGQDASGTTTTGAELEAGQEHPLASPTRLWARDTGNSTPLTCQ
eukprot:3306711-Rhodomonas_salina.2